MKQWIFVVGILGSGIMFLISGTLIGYAIHEYGVQSIASQSPENRERKPELSNIDKMALLSSQIPEFKIPFQKKERAPTDDALNTANSYNKS
ncbi:MAG: hypothetical protein LBI20_01490 [Holosporales bacterium]|jgi:hypothetical protein|nr:hypothetical protein [Holosporales bacterium]